jgi:hypothetical protein
MPDTRELILCHTFTQQNPKSISNKVIANAAPPKDKKFQGNRKYQNIRKNKAQGGGGILKELVSLRLLQTMTRTTSSGMPRMGKTLPRSSIKINVNVQSLMMEKPFV